MSPEPPTSPLSPSNGNGSSPDEPPPAGTIRSPAHSAAMRLGPALALWQLLRVPNGLIVILGVWVGALALESFPPLTAVFWASLNLFFLTLAGNVHNDICDWEVDRLAHPDRPLPRGSLSLRSAWIWTGVLCGAGLLSGGFLGRAHLLLAVFIAVLLWVYNTGWKKAGLLGNVTVALLCGFPLYILEYPAALRHTFFPFLFAFLTTLLREVIKDLEDAEADKKGGRKTFPILYGTQKTRRWATLLWIILLGCLPLPYVWQYHPSYFFVVAAVTLPALVLSLVFLYREQWRRSQTWMKWAMLSGMAALACGLYFR